MKLKRKKKDRLNFVKKLHLIIKGILFKKLEREATDLRKQP
jgi:hypothetical protein